MQESKHLVSVTNRSECHLESTILVWVSFRSIRHKIGPRRACCALAMGRDQNRVNLVDGGMVLVMGQDAWVLPAIVRGSSGTALGSSRCAGACAVISGVIVSPAVISGPAIGCVNSFPFVRWLWFWFWWWWMRRYAPPIWCDDMRHRYGATICATDMQGMKTEKGQEHMLLALMLFVIRYFTFVV